MIVLDQLNAKVELSGVEWQEIVLGLNRAEGEPGIYFYLLTKDGALFPIYGLPDWWTQAAATTFRASEILPLFEEMRHQIRPRPDDLDVSRSEPGEPHFDLVMKRKQLYTATALQQLSTRLASFPGSKCLVWIGPGTDKPVSGDPTVKIHSEWGDSPQPLPTYYVGAAESATFKDNPNRPRPIDRRVDETLALALADTERGYRIGYYPAAGNWDGRQHDLRITCTRPHVTVRSKTSYAAIRPADVEDDPRQALADLATVSLYSSSTIRFRAEPASLRVNANDVFFDPSGDSFTCSLAVQAMQVRDGAAFEIVSDPLIFDLRFTAAESQAALRDVITLRFPTPTPSSGIGYRIVVLDRTTQSFGTLTIPLARRPE